MKEGRTDDVVVTDSITDYNLFILQPSGGQFSGQIVVFRWAGAIPLVLRWVVCYYSNSILLTYVLPPHLPAYLIIQ